MSKKGNKVTVEAVAKSLDNKKLKNPKNWPKSLHTFIADCFKKVATTKLNDNQEIQFKNQLKNLINMAVRNDKIMENDWTKQELPIFDKYSSTKLQLYCDSMSEIDSPITNEKKANNKGATTKRKNIFGEEESDSDSDQYTPSTKPVKKSFSLGDSVKRLKKQKREPVILLESVPKQLTDEEKRNLRSKRFERELSIPTFDNSTSKNNDIVSTDPIIGKNEDLEKKYLRLTSQPKPETVRPLRVLKKTLQFLFDKHFEGATYNYLCDQCKSLRQDLTVQNIRNDFTVMAYEFHSKLAIENGDWGEFNQCQSQLKLLYKEKGIRKPNYFEFLSYRVLYLILTDNSNDVFELELSLMDQGYLNIPDKMLVNAIDIFKYIKNSDYYNLSKIVQQIFDENIENEEKIIKPGHILITDPDALLIKHNRLYYFAKFVGYIIDRENIRTLSIICKGYKQISLAYLKEIFCKKNNDQGFNDFLQANLLNSYINEGGIIFNCNNARNSVQNLMNKTFKKIDIKGQI